MTLTADGMFCFCCDRKGSSQQSEIASSFSPLTINPISIAATPIDDSANMLEFRDSTTWKDVQVPPNSAPECIDEGFSNPLIEMNTEIRPILADAVNPMYADVPAEMKDKSKYQAVDPSWLDSQHAKLANLSWFRDKGTCTAKDAVKELMGDGKQGHFLMRVLYGKELDTLHGNYVYTGNYAISVRLEAKVYSLLVLPSWDPSMKADGQTLYRIGTRSKLLFESIPQLVEYYSKRFFKVTLPTDAPKAKSKKKPKYKRFRLVLPEGGSGSGYYSDFSGLLRNSDGTYSELDGISNVFGKHMLGSSEVANHALYSGLGAAERPYIDVSIAAKYTDVTPSLHPSKFIHVSVEDDDVGSNSTNYFDVSDTTLSSEKTEVILEAKLLLGDAHDTNSALRMSPNLSHADTSDTIEKVNMCIATELQNDGGEICSDEDDV